MSDSNPNDVSRAHGRERGTVPCRERDRLRNALQKIQHRLDELVTQELAAFQVNDQARFWRLNRDMEPLHDERVRAEDALLKHIRTHCCQPLGEALS